LEKKDDEPDSIETEEETVHSRSTSFDEFNGPSMIAVEPDEQSSQKLRQLRELIRRELLMQEHNSSSPSSSSSSSSLLWNSPVPFMSDGTEYNTDHDLNEQSEEFLSSFRPLVPIGAYPTIDAALMQAKKLKGFWDPLTFSVTDLHFISQAPSSRQNLAESTEANYYSLNFDPAASVNGFFPANNLVPESKRKQQVRDAGAVFGCDAVVMLMGEEIEMDDESNQLLANMVWEEGTPGGYLHHYEGIEGDDSEVSVRDDSSEKQITGGNDETSDSRYADYPRELDAKGGDYEDLLSWLDADDDDDDEGSEDIGTQVVIGRTHMFSGEKRIYAGMPASSTAEEADGTFSLSNVFGNGKFKR